ncbi:MAG: CotH kinase family protein, partial [Christensenellales bacterium]
PESGKNVSFGVNAEEQWAYFAQPTPGAANTTANFPELAAAMEAAAPAVLINEVAAAKPLNSSHRDWVELYNGSEEAVDLTGWRLSASSDIEKGVALSGMLKAGGYLVVKDISVSASGENLYLFDASGRLVDRYASGLIRPGYSSGLTTLGQRAFFANATPGAPNGDSAISGYTAEPVFSRQGGYVSEAFELAISCATDGATIYYTTDGSKPTVNSKVYSSPIKIEKNTCVKAVAKAEGTLMSDQMVATYLFDTHATPVICLSIGDGDLSYISASENRRDLREREGYAEYYTKDGVLGVRFPAGMRIGGNSTRLYPQRTFSLHLRGGYGQSSVTYPFFEGYGVKEFSSLVLRNCGQDQAATMLRDAYASMAVNGMNIDNAQSTFVTVYINGKYWGLYEFKENQNEDYYAGKYGVDPGVVQGVRSNTYVYNGVGDNKGIKNLFALAAKDTSDASVYAQYAAKADEDMFIDYLIAQCFFSNNDAYNQKYMGSTDGSMKWRPVFYDLDFALSGNSSSKNVFGLFFRQEVVYVGVPDEQGNRNFVDMGLYYGFYKNAAWREKFVNRFAEVMNTVLTTDRLVSILDDMVALMEPEMARHVSRWKRPASVSGWKSEIKAFRQCIIDRRANYLKEFKRTFNVSDARMKELFPND